jgi:SAM-dependent methyltransferase
VLAQADALRLPLRPGSFDLVWSVNTIHHLRAPLEGVKRLAELLRAGGRVALVRAHCCPRCSSPGISASSTMLSASTTATATV